jgi:hypothetical protein
MLAEGFEVSASASPQPFFPSTRAFGASFVAQPLQQHRSTFNLGLLDTEVSNILAS